MADEPAAPPRGLRLGASLFLASGFLGSGLGIYVMSSSNAVTAAFEGAGSQIASFAAAVQIGIGLYALVWGLVTCASAFGLFFGSPLARFSSIAIAALGLLSSLPSAAILTLLSPLAPTAALLWFFVVADALALWVTLQPSAGAFFSRDRSRPTPPVALGWVGVGLLALLVTGFGYVMLWALKDKGGVPGEAWRILVTQPFGLDRVISILAIVLIFAAGIVTPIAIAETRSVRAYERLEAEVRALRPDDVVTPYEGEEGEGLTFDAPDGSRRTLVLRPEGGVGEPRVVEVAHAPPAPAPEGDNRTSPLGS